jgi:flagellin-like protein
MTPVERVSHRTESSRAVSPVIGVILMVAITVILAAVIGAFVLEIGDQQETAPSSSFDTSQYDYTYDIKGNPPNIGPNMTIAEFTHAGGEVVDRTQVQSKVNGNPTTFTGFRRKGGPDDVYSPFPAIQKTRADNAVRQYQSKEPRDDEWTSGEGFELWSYGFAARTSPLDTYEKSYAGLYECIGSQTDSNNRYQYADYKNGGSWRNIDYEQIAVADSGNVNECHHANYLLQQGDDVTVVWTASSGGKTQTLFKYTVQ